MEIPDKKITPWYKRPQKSLREYKKLVEIDTLTEVKSRVELYDELSKKGIKDTSILFIDIDKFKDVNDSHGDSYGDEVLKIFGARLRGKFTHVYRKGGDELIVILRSVALDVAKTRAENFREEMEKNTIVTSDGTKLNKTVSIGVANGNNYLTPDELITAAGVAMHRAKESGRNRVVVAQSV